MTAYDYFELQRQSDELVYQFDRRPRGYQRRDMDLWIMFLPDWGWVAYDEATQSVTGRPWDVLPKDQTEDHPPEGDWVSKKGVKSYVYRLKYCEAAA